MPLAPADQDGIDQQTSLFKDLGEASTAQELLIRQLSVARVPSEFAFPPLADIRALQGNLPAGTHILSFLSTSRGMYGFLISQETYGGWRLESPAKLRRQVSNLLACDGELRRRESTERQGIARYGMASSSSRTLSVPDPRRATSQAERNTRTGDRAGQLPVVRPLRGAPAAARWHLQITALTIHHPLWPNGVVDTSGSTRL